MGETECAAEPLLQLEPRGDRESAALPLLRPLLRPEAEAEGALLAELLG